MYYNWYYRFYILFNYDSNNKYKMNRKAKLWIARDKYGILALYNIKPIRQSLVFVSENDYENCLIIDENSHPEITWENSPQQIEI